MTPLEILTEKYNHIKKIINDNNICAMSVTTYNIIKYTMLMYIQNNIELFVYISNGKRGVYFIEDFYIGRTSDIYVRLSYHILESIEEMREKGHNIDKCEKIKYTLSERKLNVEIISKNQNHEQKLIEEYSSIYNLTNIEFNKNRTKKIIDKNVKSENVNIEFKNNFNTDDECMYNDLSYFIELKNFFILKDDNTFLAILRNKNSNRVGIYTTRCKYSLCCDFGDIKRIENRLILEDYQKYGLKSFEIEFIKIKHKDYNKLKKTYLEYLNINKIELYNRIYKTKDEIKINLKDVNIKYLNI